jgi:UPF0755 protein
MPSFLTRPLGRVLAAGVVLMLVGAGWFALQVDPIFSSAGKVVIVTVHPGDSMATIASEMHTKGVIASALAFRVDALVFGAPVVQPGSYEIAQGSSFAHVMAVLGSAPNVVVIDVTPGLTLHEVAVNVANYMGNAWADSFARVATNAQTPSPFARGTSLEGLIGAGQYIVTPGTTPSMLAKRMVDGFVREAASVGLTPTSTLHGLNAYQLVIATSIVEKEGYYPKNMPRVARVIFNRLKRGGGLQMDSTVLYYLGQDGGTVTHADLQLHTPYNTYLYPGLTPTPICAVSTIALSAVLHAPPGSWLYFTLIKKDGTMAFANTFAQQLDNEKLAQLNGIG